MTTPLAPPSSVFSENSAWMIGANAGMALFSMPTPPDGEDDFYLRETDGSFVDVGPVTPPAAGPTGRGGEPPGYNGMAATADFSHLVADDTSHLWPFDTPSGTQVIEWVGTGDRQPFLVGVNSEGKPFDCETTLSGLSADGRIVYFKACGQEYARVDGEEPVVEGVRRKPETVAISAPQCGASAAPGEVACREAPAGEASSVGNSADGSRAFFLDTQQLTDEATQGTGDSQGGGCLNQGSDCNLYMYDFGLPEGQRLIDVSAAGADGTPEVQGVVAVSGDGSHVYFVANGVLAPGARRGTCHADQGAQGACNLYVYERDERYPQGHLAFVARVPEADEAYLWRAERSANVTPDGRFLVFESHGDLTPDDTRSDGYTQVFRYDADPTAGEEQAGMAQLLRVSIGQDGYDDDGNGGVGDTAIKGPGGGHAGLGRGDPTMSDNGSFVFFQSPIAFTPNALNDVVIGHKGERGQETVYAENVYEWEAPGTEVDGKVACEQTGGCVYLISDGRDVSEGTGWAPCFELSAPNEYSRLSATCLIGTDASGRDVFFYTADQLVPKDTDTQVDIYDARICEPENGNPCITEPPKPLPPCQGEQCHGIPAATPSLLAPGTAAFNGEGNITPSPPPPTPRATKKTAQCKKVIVRGKGKKKAECLAKKSGKKAKKAKRASNDRRAHR